MVCYPYIYILESFSNANLHCLTDAASAEPRKFLIDIDETLHSLLQREDTDKNMQITIEDVGPKVRWNI